MPFPPVKPGTYRPSQDELLDQLTASVMETQDSFPTSCPEYCEVEPDGTCQHGHPSWLKRAGLI